MSHTCQKFNPSELEDLSISQAERWLAVLLMAKHHGPSLDSTCGAKSRSVHGIWLSPGYQPQHLCLGGTCQGLTLAREMVPVTSRGQTPSPQSFIILDCAFEAHWR